MKELSLDDLHLFTRVIALGTLSAAARERNAPVSMISRAVKRMETASGARLLRRSTHGFTLTAEGETFLAYCRSINDSVNALELEFANKAAEPAGRVRLSVSTAMAQYVIVPALPSLRDKHPKLELDMLVNDHLVDMVRDGIDIAIRTGDSAPGTTVMRTLGQLKTRLYASPSYLRQHGKPRSADELAQHRLLPNCTHPVLNEWHFGNKRSLHAQGPLRSDNTAIIVAMALQGLGIAHLPIVVGEPFVQQTLLAQVLSNQLKEATIRVSAVIAADRQRLPKIRACVEHFSAWFARP